MKKIQDDFLIDLTPFERPVIMHFSPELPQEVRAFLIKRKQKQAVDNNVVDWKRTGKINLNFEYPPIEAHP